MCISCHLKQFSSQLKYKNYGLSLGGNSQLNRAVFKVFLNLASLKKIRVLEPLDAIAEIN